MTDVVRFLWFATRSGWLPHFTVEDKAGLGTQDPLALSISDTLLRIFVYHME